MKRKLVTAFMILVLAVGVIPSGAFAAGGGVRVSLPGFDVLLNGVKVENEYRQYPLIVYRDITYFPMTYFDCRFLGVETRWDQDKGLEIDKTGITGAYRNYEGKSKNAAGYAATVPDFEVSINGKAVNNAQEEYPLLVFRDVTYFPMTWRFCVEELGWEYNFDAADGLVINSSNQRLEKYVLREYADGPVIVSGGYFYYGGPEGGIYQAPLDKPKDARKIYQLPLWSYGDSYVPYGLSKKDGEAWLDYHQGGAAMGTDFYIRLNPDGTTQEVERGYLTFKNFGNITVKVDQWAPPVRNNLMIKPNGGQEEYRTVGSSDYQYGWDYELREDGSQGGSPSKDIYMKDGIIYILAVDKTKETDQSRIYSVNILTSETERVSDVRVNTFKMDGDTIYAISGGDLYQISLDGSVQSRLETAGPVSRGFGIQVLGGNIYYVNGDDSGLYAVGKDGSLNPGGRVNGLKIEQDHLICTFEEENSNPYRIMVTDKTGGVVFKTSDVAKINAVSIENGRLYYMENAEEEVYSTDLAD